MTLARTLQHCLPRICCPHALSLLLGLLSTAEQHKLSSKDLHSLARVCAMHCGADRRRCFQQAHKIVSVVVQRGCVLCSHQKQLKLVKTSYGVQHTAANSSAGREAEQRENVSNATLHVVETKSAAEDRRAAVADTAKAVASSNATERIGDM